MDKEYDELLELSNSIKDELDHGESKPFFLSFLSSRHWCGLLEYCLYAPEWVYVQPVTCEDE